jgi:hypothetical protein
MGSVASVKKIPFYANDCEPIKNVFIDNQDFMILDCPGFDCKKPLFNQMRQNQLK